MSGYVIRGGAPLRGSVRVSGAKNAVLPILCACLLCEGETVLTNCPRISDVLNTLEILEELGCETSFKDGQIRINADSAAPLPVGKAAEKMRSAALFAGALCGRFGKAELAAPGGCMLGSRPLDIHIGAFEKMGIACRTDGVLRFEGRPHGADVFLRYPSVGATENVMLAAATGRGTVTVTGAAREPEVVDLAGFLNAAGAKIRGAGSGIIIIEGVEKLRGVRYNIMGDRIEAATFLAAGAATGGEVTVYGAEPEQLAAVTDVIVRAGGSVCRKPDSVSAGGRYLCSPGVIETAPYPGFPTDVQSIAAAMLLCAHGRTEIRERVFDDRLRVFAQFAKMGADVSVSGTSAVIRGAERLHGETLSACDLRSGAGLVIAALCADGESRIENISHIERGYEDFEQKLSALGAFVRKY